MNYFCDVMNEIVSGNHTTYNYSKKHSEKKDRKMPDTMQQLQLFERNQKFRVCYIFNCDKTCNLDEIETLLSGSKGKLGSDVVVFKHNVSEISWQSSEMYDSIVPDLPMDFAIFVVHANEVRLSINEDIVRNGNAKIYRTLLKAAGVYVYCKLRVTY